MNALPSSRVCPRCEGEGELAFNPSPDLDPQMDDHMPCPACGGTGEPPASAPQGDTMTRIRIIATAVALATPLWLDTAAALARSSWGN